MAGDAHLRQRLKQSGMHWTITGANAIFALRCHEASGSWEAICNEVHTQACPPDQEDPADEPDYLQN